MNIEFWMPKCSYKYFVFINSPSTLCNECINGFITSWEGYSNQSIPTVHD